MPVSRVRFWLAFTTAVAVLVALFWIPLPGVALDELEWTQGAPTALGLLNMSLPRMPVGAIGFGTLLFVEICLAVSRSTNARVGNSLRIATAVYVAGSLLWAFGIVLWIEGVDYDLSLGQTVIDDPGWGFRIQSAAALMGANMLLWIVARWIDRLELGSGGLLLYGLYAIAAAFGSLAEAGMSAQSAWDPLLALASIVPYCVLLIGLRQYKPPWPLTLLGGLRAHSLLELLTLPAVASYAVRVTTSHDWLLAPAVALLVAVLLVLRLRTGAARGSALYLLGAIGMLVAGAVPVGLGFFGGGGFARVTEPGPYAGIGSFEVTLESTGRTGTSDARVFLRRFEGVEIDATAIGVSPSRLTFRLEGVGSANDVVRDLVPGQRLELHWFAADQSPVARTDLPPEFHGLRIEFDEVGEETLLPLHVVVGDLASLHAFFGQMTPPDATRVAFAPWNSFDARTTEYVARLIETRAIVTSDDVIEAQSTKDPQTRQPTVTVRLSDASGLRFADETDRGVGRLLAILIDGQIESAPVVREPIAAGRLQITLGSQQSGNPLQSATRLAAALRSRPLQSTWTVVSVRPLGSEAAN